MTLDDVSYNILSNVCIQFLCFVYLEIKEMGKNIASFGFVDKQKMHFMNVKIKIFLNNKSNRNCTYILRWKENFVRSNSRR